MDKKSVTNEEAKILLTQNNLRYNTIKKIRRGGYEHYIGWALAFLFILSPIIIKRSQKQIYIYSAIGLAIGLRGEQKWNEKRFNTLIDFLEKEGVVSQIKPK